MFKIIHPLYGEEMVTENKMLTKGLDAWDNGQLSDKPIDACHSAILLDDAGIIALVEDKAIFTHLAKHSAELNRIENCLQALNASVFNSK